MRRPRILRVRFDAAIALILMLAIVAGCTRTPDGPKRNALSGVVTVQGKPVPAGRIIFSPDAEKGNSGPGATAFIVNGRYQTPDGHGVVSGAHVVDILGYEESGNSDEDDAGAVLVKKTLEMDVPKEGGKYDFTF